MLGNVLGSSASAAPALNLSAVSPVPGEFLLLVVCFALAVLLWL